MPDRLGVSRGTKKRVGLGFAVKTCGETFARSLIGSFISYPVRRLRKFEGKWYERGFERGVRSRTNKRRAGEA